MPFIVWTDFDIKNKIQTREIGVMLEFIKAFQCHK